MTKLEYIQKAILLSEMYKQGRDIDPFVLDAVLSTAKRYRDEIEEADRIRNPLAYWRPIRIQQKFLEATDKYKLFRAGTQNNGKSTTGLVDTIFRALGRHPYRPDIDGKVYPLQWVVGATIEQTQVLQSKMWDLLPKEALEDGCYFDRSTQKFYGKYPIVRFKNGSIIQFKSSAGDNQNFASATVDHILIDELPDKPEVIDECFSRINKHNGDLTLTLTPLHKPCDWLKEKCQKGEIADYHFPLRPDNFYFPDGSLMTNGDQIIDEPYIAKQLLRYHKDFADVYVHGAWESRVADAWFKESYTTDIIKPYKDFAKEFGRFTEYVLGVDIGDRPGKQCAYLIGIVGQRSEPIYYVIDEYIAKEKSTPKIDAEGFIEMLGRNGLGWSDLKECKTDRAHKAGSPHQKAASDFNRELARKLGLTNPRKLFPSFKVAKKGAGRGSGSVTTRSLWLHHRILEGQFFINKRCSRLIEAMPKYHPKVDDDNKDPIDAIVYGLDSYIYDVNPVKQYNRTILLDV